MNECNMKLATLVESPWKNPFDAMFSCFFFFLFCILSTHTFQRTLNDVLQQMYERYELDFFCNVTTICNYRDGLGFQGSTF